MLLTASLSTAVVKNDDQGNNPGLVKRGTNNTVRDDVAAALVLVPGVVRSMEQPAVELPGRGATETSS